MVKNRDNDGREGENEVIMLNMEYRPVELLGRVVVSRANEKSQMDRWK